MSSALQTMPVADGNVSSFLQPFPGPMTRLAELSLKYQHRQQPALTVGAALAAMSACLHGRWALEDGLRGNLYVVGLGGTGSGKDAMLDLVRTVVEVAGGSVVSNIGSGQGLENALLHSPERRVSLVVDELAHLIGAISGTKAASYQTAAEKLLLEVFSKSASSMSTRVLAKAPAAMLVCPYVSMVGVATHAEMRGISPTLIQKGLLGRCLMLNGLDFAPLQEHPHYGGSLYADIDDAVGAVARSVYKFGPPMANSEDGLLKVPLTPRAQALEREASREFDAIACTADDTRRALCMRAVEQAKRIALVLAAWDDLPVVTEEHLDWALRFVRYSHACLMSFVDGMTDSQVVRDARKIEQIVRDAVAGRKPFRDVKYAKANAIAADRGLVSHSALLKKSRLDTATFKRCIAHLLDERVIGEEHHDRPTRGGPARETYYLLID